MKEWSGCRRRTVLKAEVQPVQFMLNTKLRVFKIDMYYNVVKTNVIARRKTADWFCFLFFIHHIIGGRSHSWCHLISSSGCIV